MTEHDAPPALLAILQSNWQSEMEDHTTYKALALAELDARRRNVMRGLASAEKHHAHLWAAEIAVLGGPKPLYVGMESGRAIVFSGPAGGVDAELHQLRIKERSEIERYDAQRLLLTTSSSQKILREVIADENEHYKILSALIRARPPLPAMDDSHARAALAALLAARRKQHPQVAGWTNEAIYAAHDGLGSIFGIVSGVAGATFGQSRYVLIAGLAGMMGSALSTGTGAYLTAKSEREIYDAVIARERRAVDFDESESREVLALSLQVRGLPEDVAGRLSHLLAENKESFVKALARTGANLSEENLKNPWIAALTGFAATAIGAFVPMIPFFFVSGIWAIVIAAIVSLSAHFAIGSARSLMTIRPWWRSGLELTAFGALEGATTFSIGMALGHMIGTR
ncbi:VIT1/CCC1 family predicted Fe2+/Mn2+ transporter [Granulicella aggregans]|jgi:VIT1/CCC1 family predicted Fe2+/Mn2+ transporter|uniref:VIT1/CCC1 family predicted Fe2+/Mn2+ transporter n=1 Tax=Granulicella aggregans TaxID=474949 RepID=A0A7W7ZHN6_9BACT|nr:VIT1/CCC1 transporter family protein [Granulicella aggregans]MBB5059923.1 VIT1/CCC1 family predicted Fe2+/Mn2+ transporter [Granulicella aggregans]